MLFAAFECWVRGYLLKNAHKTEIIEAIKTVHNHEMYYCKQTSNKLIQLLARSNAGPMRQSLRPKFTDRETEVIHLICKEYSNTEISDELCLSIRTIEGYRKKIQEKMMVRNTAGIVVYAIKNGIYKL